MKIFTEKILEILKYSKSLNPEKFTPICLVLNQAYETKLMKELVQLISNDEKGFISQTRSILEEERLAEINHGFKFTLKACIANNKDISDINNLLKKTEGFEINESEIEEAFFNSPAIIKRKVDYKNINEIEKLIASRIGNYDYCFINNNNYTSSKRSFTFALILISNHLKRFNNPIDTLSNDYSLLKDFYKSKNIDLMNDNQFSKYGLISLNDNFYLGNEYPSRIYDKNIEATIFLNGLEDYTFKYLSKLYKEFSLNLSVKPSSIFFLNSFYTQIKLEEHLEVGHYFDIENFDTNCITKLYDHDYNVLWINVDKQNITFEEVLQDFEFYDSSIVTQVLHCEYIYENNDLFITHLDHEFIFYTIDEYDNRQTDVYQKGSDKPRIKTFKIDKAKIPITKEENCLFEILNMKFNRRELLKEYFGKITEN